MWYRLSIGIIPLLVFAGCAYYPVQEDTNYYGVIIGINEYQDMGIRNLSWCVNDAECLVSALTENGWQREEITLLVDEGATKKAILGSLRQVLERAGPDDYILIYYSGHGTFITDDSGDESDGTDEAIVPADARLGYPSTYIIDDELAEIFSGCRTEKGVVIFDACNSGGIINSGLASGRILNPRTIDSGANSGFCVNGDLDILLLPVITASGQLEYSWEDSKLQHGIFTYFFLDGFRAADSNGDDRLTINELYYYAKKNTEFYISSQHPQLKYNWDMLDVLITR